MNRTNALLAALALLLAHALAIHHTPEGVFAPPYERAHAAFRFARNIVYDGQLAWQRGDPMTEGYPSPLWLLLSCIPQRLYASPLPFAQCIGVLSTLLTVVVVANFSRERLAGVIAPLLLVVNGALAACATDGTETAMFTLFLVASLLAFERGSGKSLATFTCLACLTRPEGALFSLALLSFELVRGKERRSPVLRALIAPALVVTLLALCRLLLFGSSLSPTMAALLNPTLATSALGLEAVWANALLLISPLLIVIPLLCLMLGKLSALGTRSLLLGLAWVLLVIVQGSDERPFGAALVPALPFVFIAVQQALTASMDSGRLWLERLSWIVFLSTLSASALASKLPGNMGPLRTAGYMASRLEPSAKLMSAYGHSLGRIGVQEELEETLLLRRLSIFLRDRLAPGASILTPWPGAIGYLTRKDVIDMRGRVQVAPGESRPNPWNGTPQVDLLAQLETRPNYIVPSIKEYDRSIPLDVLATDWLQDYDKLRDEPGRLARCTEFLKAEYELISVPLPSDESPRADSYETFCLLRSRALGLGSHLEISIDGDELRVHVRHRGHQQLVDLELEMTDSEGSHYWVTPTGQLSADARVHARIGLLLYEVDSPLVELIRWRVPSDREPVQFAAVLRNPNSQSDHEFSAVSEKVVLRP